ncbi:MAG: NAD(P)H-dependent glycerol-3-phosphate dehydrogenase [bacterium]
MEKKKTPTDLKNICVAGSGSWGTTLASVLAENGHNVFLWSNEQNVADEINSTHINSNFLPGIELPATIIASNSPEILNASELIINTIPTQYIRSSIIKQKLPFKDKYVVNCSKGIELNTMHRISEIFYEAAEITSDRYAVLTGPSLAREVANHEPTTLVTATKNIELSGIVQNIFSNTYLRVYSSYDVIGCELGGALKNVMAIAIGMVAGLGYGDNAKAALLTRGIAEITRLGHLLGAKKITFAGLSLLGDLFVTCTSEQSRNRQLGVAIGKGETLAQIQAGTKTVAEGVETTRAIYSLAQELNVEMPITEELYHILFTGAPARNAIDSLMNRDLEKEWWWHKIKETTKTLKQKTMHFKDKTKH